MRILLNTKSNLVKSTLAEHLESFMMHSRNENDNKLLKQNEVLSFVLSCVENFQPGFESVSLIVVQIFNFSLDTFYQLVKIVM